MELSPNHIETTVREQWLDKLWIALFEDSQSGLMSPGQIRREHRNRQQVRQIEMAAIIDAEKEMNAIHNGTKAIDEYGNLIDTPKVDMVSTHQIIENTAIEQGLDIGLDSPEKMIRSVVKELSVRDLERSLNIRKMAILAETEILASDIRPISNNPVKAEWLRRWREAAGNVFDPELQALWSRALINEVAQPSSYSFVFITTLEQMTQEDMEVLSIAGKYTFERFIYNPSGSYFKTDFHRGLFEVMDDLALIGSSSSKLQLESDIDGSYQRLLVCRHKGLKFVAKDETKVLTIPAIKLTRVGQQLMPLISSKADSAYLFNLANLAKEQGFDVVLGDWNNEGGRGRFVEKMSL